jgi:ribonuclease J
MTNFLNSISQVYIMGIEICTVGGYEEVGKNCTAINIDGEVIIIDLGLHLDNYIPYREAEDIIPNADDMIKIGAVPDLSCISNWLPKVKALVIGHAHLDHAGAVPFLSNRIKAPVICTQFTKEVISAMANDEKIRLKNPIKALNANSKMQITENLKLEFITITHSTVQTVMIALHTKYGVIVYANDFKFDNSPVIGKAPNYERFSELSKKGVLALIVDSTRASLEMKTPSEMVAKEMLKDVLLATHSEGNIVIVTTFSSHIARLKSIIEFGKSMKRRVVFLGRSLAKYVFAAENANLVDFSKNVEIVKYSNMVKKKLKNIEKDREKYLLVVTGHQGEPGSVLTKIAFGRYDFKLMPNDHIVFSCTVIPNEENRKNREKLEEQLKKYKVRIFKDIHVSGHASKEDLRDLISMLKPKNVIPAHGTNEMKQHLANLCLEMGYNSGKVHMLGNGKRIKFV